MVVQMRERHLSEKMFFHVIPVLGAILTSYDLLLLWNRRFGWKETPYYSWCFRISQLIAWVMLVGNYMLCFYFVLFIVNELWKSK